MTGGPCWNGGTTVLQVVADAAKRNGTASWIISPSAAGDRAELAGGASDNDVRRISLQLSK